MTKPNVVKNKLNKILVARYFRSLLKWASQHKEQNKFNHHGPKLTLRGGGCIVYVIWSMKIVFNKLEEVRHKSLNFRPIHNYIFLLVFLFNTFGNGLLNLYYLCI